MVILTPPSAQTLRLVIVDTRISTKPVKHNPTRECTVSIRLIDPEKKMKKIIYERYRITVMTDIFEAFLRPGSY